MKKINLNRIDFKYQGVDYDYDTEHSCSDSGCDSDGICRCGVIVNARVTDVDIPYMAKSIYDLYFENTKDQKRDSKISTVLYGTTPQLDLYCIDRILRKNKIWDPDKWYVEKIGGYYGEEIGTVTIDFASDIQKSIDEVLSMVTIKEKVDYILKLEYGYLLPELVDADYELKTIPVSDVVFGSEGHYKKIQTENLAHYTYPSYCGIMGVLKRDGDKYRIIDGYHRIFGVGLGKTKVNQIDVILVR